MPILVFLGSSSGDSGGLPVAENVSAYSNESALGSFGGGGGTTPPASPTTGRAIAPLAVQLRSADGTALLAEWSGRLTGVSWALGTSGPESFAGALALPFVQALRLAQAAQAQRLAVLDAHGRALWAGRVRAPGVSREGLSVEAEGPWAALGDVPYSGLWRDATLERWREATSGDLAAIDGDRAGIEIRDGVIKLFPKAGEDYGSTEGYIAACYVAPVGGDQGIRRLSFSYSINADVPSDGWRLQVYSYAAGFASQSSAWFLAATGSLQTGSQTLTLSNAAIVAFVLWRNNGTAAEYGGETGDALVEVSSVVVSGLDQATITAADVAEGLLAYVVDINPTQLSASTARIQDPGVNLEDAVFEDETPAEILERLVALGDDETPPRPWVVGVDAQRRLYLQPRDGQGRSWTVDVSDITITATIDDVVNSVYGTYAAGAETQRTATSSDAASIARLGLTRRRAASGASSAAATQQRDATLADGKAPPPRATIQIARIRDAAGASWPLHALAPGDQVTVAGLPLEARQALRAFTVAHVDYDADEDAVTVEPQTPTGSLDALALLLAQRRP
jgi:hypothetical protein